MSVFRDIPQPVEVEDLSPKECGFQTDIPGVTANDYVTNGSVNIPVFDVSPQDFYQNSQNGRNGMTFISNKMAQNYFKNGIWNPQFYVQFKDNEGQIQRKMIKRDAV